jgi:hypothetical protein
MRRVLVSSAALMIVGSCARGPALEGPTRLSRPSPTDGLGLHPSSARTSDPMQAPVAAGEPEPPDPIEDPEPIEDGVEPGGSTEGEPLTHPLDGLSLLQLEERFTKDPSSLGSISWGQPNVGALLNGVKMPPGRHHTLIDPAHAWGTRETIDGLLHSLRVVNERWPDTTPLYIGHLSREHGGPLSPHVSHQSGRDVDVGYYLKIPGRPFVRATPSNLDADRTWTLVRTLITDTDLDLLLIDRSLQAVLRDHAQRNGEDAAWLDSLFDGVPGRLRPLVLHARGHATHLHVRFTSPLARETARRLGSVLEHHRAIGLPQRIVTHKVRPGETLGLLAKRYASSVAAIMQANGLASTRIRVGRVYRIPVPTKPDTVMPLGRPVVVEKRRLPPSG